jgi:hypothetical protein
MAASGDQRQAMLAAEAFRKLTIKAGVLMRRLA